MRILRKLGSLALLSLAVAMFGSSSGCIFQADTPDKVEVKPVKPDADIDVHIDKNG